MCNKKTKQKKKLTKTKLDRAIIYASVNELQHVDVCFHDDRCCKEQAALSTCVPGVTATAVGADVS